MLHTHGRHGGVGPQLRNRDGFWPRRHNESSSSLARCRTPCLAMHRLQIYPSLPIITLSRSSWLSGLSGSMARNRDSQASRSAPPHTTSMEHSPLLLILYFSYSSMTLNSPSKLALQRSVQGIYTNTNDKSSERRKHCALAVVRRNQKFSPRRRPPSRGRRTAKI